MHFTRAPQKYELNETTYLAQIYHEFKKYDVFVKQENNIRHMTITWMGSVVLENIITLLDFD